MSKTPKRDQDAPTTEDNAAEEVVIDYDRLLYRCPISYPFSSDKPKLTKKIYSLIKKAVTADKKRGVVKGIKDVTKVIRKQNAPNAKKPPTTSGKSLVVLGSDVSPFDVVSHLPVLLEESNIPYVWVPSRQDLGTATQCKRATSVVLLRSNAEIEASLIKVLSAIEEINQNSS